MALAAAPAWAAGEFSNRRAPGFSLPDLKLKLHDLADYRGKVVLLEIMQTTCPHCGKFVAVLEEISQKYAGRVQVLSIVNYPPENDVSVAKFVKEHGLSHPVLFDCGQVARSYTLATPQKSLIEIPHVFVIDQQGVIRNDFVYGLLTRGPIFEGRGLFDEVEKLLGAGETRGATKSSPKK